MSGERNTTQHGKRGIAFVDGFNVYHFLEEHHPWAKWLNYRLLADEGVRYVKTVEHLIVYHIL